MSPANNNNNNNNKSERPVTKPADISRVNFPANKVACKKVAAKSGEPKPFPPKVWRQKSNPGSNVREDLAPISAQDTILVPSLPVAVGNTPPKGPTSYIEALLSPTKKPPATSLPPSPRTPPRSLGRARSHGSPKKALSPLLPKPPAPPYLQEPADNYVGVTPVHDPGFGPVPDHLKNEFYIKVLVVESKERYQWDQARWTRSICSSCGVTKRCTMVLPVHESVLSTSCFICHSCWDCITRRWEKGQAKGYVGTWRWVAKDIDDVLMENRFFHDEYVPNSDDDGDADYVDPDEVDDVDVCLSPFT